MIMNAVTMMIMTTTTVIMMTMMASMIDTKLCQTVKLNIPKSLERQIAHPMIIIAARI